MSQVITVSKDTFLGLYNRASCAKINGDLYHICIDYILDVDENGGEIISHAFSASGFDVVIPIKETWFVDPIYYDPNKGVFTLGASDGEVPPFALYAEINI